MRRTVWRTSGRSLIAALAVIVLAAMPAVATSGYSAPAEATVPAAIDPWLMSHMWLGPTETRLVVIVHGTDIANARSGAVRAGLEPQHDMPLIDATVAAGDRWSVLRVTWEPGVTYVEGDRPMAYLLDTSHKATRGIEASKKWRARKRTPLDGRGVSVAVIDSGIDPTHPFFRRPDGSSVVVANLRSICAHEAEDPDPCFVNVGTDVDTDTASVGGHGTHVSGIIAGQPTRLTDGTTVVGAAPGARLVMLSTGAVVGSINSDLAMYWVLENHAAPCGSGVSKKVCPPIKVLNNSLGPLGGGDFDPESATAKLQRKLATKGVVTVWANGNDGGSGADNRSNPPGQDPTGGIISVASYNDRDKGVRSGGTSDFSSRGDANRKETWPDISAPGERITSSCRPYLWICTKGWDLRDGPGETDIGTFNTISGTSMATPHIAGIVAQLFQAKRSATPAQVERALKSSAYRYTSGAKYQRVGRYLSSYDKGAGLVDVVAAVAALQRMGR